MNEPVRIRDYQIECLDSVSTDSLPTKSQRDYLENKGGYTEKMTRAQTAFIEIRKIITSKNNQRRSMASHPITVKQQYIMV